MRYISCSKCMQLFKGNQTKIIDGVRICSTCKSKQEKEYEKAFAMYTKSNKENLKNIAMKKKVKK